MPNTTTPKRAHAPLRAEDIARELGRASSSSKGWWNCKCPVHGEDRKPSLGLKDGDYGIFVKCHAGCSREAIVAALKSRGLWTDLNREPDWVYAGEDGTPYLGVVRYQKKDGSKGYLQYHWDGKEWVSGKADGPKIPYRLPELIKADEVFVAEGEKCADRLVALGLVATTASEGAGKWSPDLNKWFAGKAVCVLPDMDNPGLKHAGQVASNVTGVAREVRIVALPGLVKGDDVADWLDRGGTKEELLALVAAAPLWTPEADDGAPEFTESALALCLAERHEHHLRFVAGWGRWMFWDGTRWQHENTRMAFDVAHGICREVAREIILRTNRSPNAIASSKTVAGVERLASADRRMAATVDQWDRDPWLLNTPGGVVDLRTGEVRPGEPEDYMTKITAVAPDPACSTKLWLSVLRRAMDDDDMMVAYLQRLFGYAATGLTREEMFAFFYGEGANGKTKIVEAVSGCLGDYHTNTPMETFLASRNERHPTEVADLCGARLVTAVETDEGRRWDAAKIKAMTGGDTLKARFMRQDFFSFKPQFTPIVHGNAKPKLRTVDEAMRRRLHIVPFEVVIPEGQRDQELSEKLKAEWPGILAWIIEGCVEWQEHGLSAPAKVREATTEYFDSQDVIGQWLEENCERDANAATNRSVLFANWSEWAKAANERAGSSAEFYEVLEKKGFEPTKHKDREFRGLRLNDKEKALPRC